MIKKLIRRISRSVAGWRTGRAYRLTKEAEGLELRAQNNWQKYPSQKFKDMNENGLAMLDLAAEKRSKAQKVLEKGQRTSKEVKPLF
ncbi:Uncharacterised protein [uncultured archaeon]|nr:Uncharacterised protein [uncultured archaeon]